jgi:PadR family transcriptional regulator AphA
MSLKHVILAVLAARPATGYDITRAFDQGLGFFWAASHQQIYRDLKALADQGAVVFEHQEQAQRPDRKLYRLTDIGRAELRAWVDGPVQHRVNSELLAKLLALEAVGRDSLLAMLARERADRERRLATYRDLEREHFSDPAALPDEEKMVRLALRRGILGEEDWLRWLDEAEAALAPPG